MAAIHIQSDPAIGAAGSQSRWQASDSRPDTAQNAPTVPLGKAGMRLVRTIHADWPVRIPGDEEGDVEYAITREEWAASGRG